MRNVSFIVVLVAAVIVLSLYVTRINRVPAGVNETLSRPGDTVKNMMQIPRAAERAVDRATEHADSVLQQGLEDAEK